jgi:hypothetical protein
MEHALLNTPKATKYAMLGEIFKIFGMQFWEKISIHCDFEYVNISQSTVILHFMCPQRFDTFDNETGRLMQENMQGPHSR